MIDGSVKSCGCLRSEKAQKNAKNLSNTRDKNFHYKNALKHIGEKYNLLQIINIERTEGKNNLLTVCKCDCGNITKQIYADLKSNKVISCGCYQKEQASKTGSNIGLNNYKNNYNWFFIKDNQIIKCRSGFEVIYANYLIQNNVDFKYEPECFKVNSGKRYIPDFYLLDEDKYIEIKGSFKTNEMYNHQKENIELFKENHNWDMLYWNDLVKICNLPFKSYSTYFRNAKKINMKIEDYLANSIYKNL